MIVVKAFDKGLKCRGYQYHEGLNVCEDANCRRNGFHAAEDPLDCLTYYQSFEDAEFWLCDAGGDMDMDERDSKVSCTEITLLKRLGLLEYVYCCLKYLADHPNRKRNERVCNGTGEAWANHFAIVEGNDGERTLAAMPKEVGDILGFHDTQTGRVAVVVCDGIYVLPGRYYDMKTQEVEVC